MRHPSFVRPMYGERCFADLPSTISHLLTQGDGPTLSPSLSPSLLGEHWRPYEKVICVFVDALGWRFIGERLDAYPLLKAFTAEGAVCQLTSQFPSTTAAHMTAFHTGLTPAEGGIYEWHIYEPGIDQMICPLPYSLSGVRVRDSLEADAATVLPSSRLYPRLAEAGVASTVYQPLEYAHSTFSRRVIGEGGVERRAIRTLPESLTHVVEQVQSTEGPAYINLYHPSVDSICHRYGPTSSEVDAEIDAVLTLLDRLLFQKLRGRCQDTLLLITADHGQVEVDPETTIYLNQDPRFDWLPEALKCNEAGTPLVPAGSCRDMFLHLKEEWHLEAVERLSAALQGVADVVLVRELIEAGYFGSTTPDERFLQRVADVVILPYRGESVWWYEEGRFFQPHRGHHGGLTREEMEIPLLAFDLSA